MARYAHQSWRDDESYPELREILAPPYRSWRAEDIETLLAAEGLDAEDLEFSLRSIGRAFRDVGRVVAPHLGTAGTIAGTLFGGPAGAALGGMAGQLAGRALGGAMGGRPAAHPGPTMSGPPIPGLGGAAGGIAGALPGIAGAIPGMVGSRIGAGGGLPITGQLMQLLSRPETQRALMAMLVGGAGRRNIPVGGAQVPVSAFANALGVLANRAAVEYAEYMDTAGADEGMAAYLTDYAGQPTADPAVPEARTARLLELLQESEPEQLRATPARFTPQAAASRSRFAFADDYYDAVEQAELAIEGEEW